MTLLKLMNVLIILGGLAGLLWFVRTKMKQYSKGYFKSAGHIEVLDDGLQIGVSHKISILRVGSELFLHSYGPSGVAFQRLEQTELMDRGEKWEDVQESLKEAASLGLNRGGKR